MKKLSLLFALLLLTALPAAAQTTARRLDNFDVPNGIRVVKPEPPAAPLQPRRRVRQTARTSAPAPAHEPPAHAAPEEDVVVAPPPPPATRPRRTLDGFSTGSPAVDALILDSCSRHGVDPLLVYSVMHQESTFKQRAISHKGARGLMQLMPATAARFGVRNIFDPRENIEGGTRYLRWLLDTFDGDVRLALAGYNAGEGAVLKYGRRVPPYSETQNYVRRITARYALMRDPDAARRAPRVTPSQVAAIKKTEKAGALYEQSVFIVRLPDGKARLVSQ
jgi:hypothetical protein